MTSQQAVDDLVTSVIVEVGGVPMSALRRDVPDPRAVVVALHGGAATSRYFDAPGRPRSSLLHAGAAAGFTVIALDRPGYGSSARHQDGMESAGRRVDLGYAAVDRLLGAGPRGAGVFLVAHSMGCALALQMAAEERGSELLGLEIAGIGRQYHARSAVVLEARSLGGPGSHQTAAAVRDLIWGPDHLYPADAAAGIDSRIPSYEAGEVWNWRGEFAALAARVRVPVRYTLGDHEAVWRSGPQALADVAGLFTASRRVLTHEQAGAGHNLSLGRTALAYHLTVLSFAEECVLARESAEDPSMNEDTGAAAAPARLTGG